MSKYKVNGEGWDWKESTYKLITSVEIKEFTSISLALEKQIVFGGIIEQRYTDQQIELLQKDEGWIAGKWSECPIDQGMFVEVKFQNSELDYMGYADGMGWECVIAYRLVTNDHYINGERIVLREGDYVEEEMSYKEHEQCMTAFENVFGRSMYSASWNGIDKPSIGKIKITGEDKLRKITVRQVLNAENAKGDNTGFNPDSDDPMPYTDDHENDTIEPEWDGKNGELPPVGVEFEIRHHGQWWVCEVLMYSGGCAWVKQGKGHHTYNTCDWTVRPIQTPRELVIEKALASINYETDPNYQLQAPLHLYIENAIIQAYDAGILIEGGK